MHGPTRLLRYRVAWRPARGIDVERDVRGTEPPVAPGHLECVEVPVRQVAGECGPLPGHEPAALLRDLDLAVQAVQVGTRILVERQRRMCVYHPRRLEGLADAVVLGFGLARHGEQHGAPV